MLLHANYETCPEASIDCIVDGRLIEDGRFVNPGLVPDDPEALKNVLKIDSKIKLQLNDAGSYNLVINDCCQLINIPKESEEYTISGRSPLRWALETLCINSKKLRETGFTDDPNLWYKWQNDSFELIRHFRRLIYISLRSKEVIDNLPFALTHQEEQI